MYHKSGKRLSLLLAACMIGGALAGCGNRAAKENAADTAATETAAQTEGTGSGVVETAASDEKSAYVDEDPATGCAVVEWVGNFAKLNSEFMEMQEHMGDEEAADPDYVGGVWSYPDAVDDSVVYERIVAMRFDFATIPEELLSAELENEAYRSLWRAPIVVVPLDASMTQEEIEEHLRQKEMLSEGQTVTSFTTRSGKTMYQLPNEDGSTGGILEYAEYVSENTKETLAKLDADWEEQRQELDHYEVAKASGITFTAMDYDGNSVDQSIFRNAKLTVVNIWGSSCASCIEEMPDLQKLNDELEDVQVITIIDDMEDLEDEDFSEEVHEITQARGMSLPVLLNCDEFKSLFPHTGTPTSYLVDADGNVIGYPRANGGTYDDYVAWIQDITE